MPKRLIEGLGKKDPFLFFRHKNRNGSRHFAKVSNNNFLVKKMTVLTRETELTVKEDLWFPYYLQNILDFVKAGVILLSPEGKILFANKMALELLKDNDLEGKDFSLFFTQQDREIFWPNVLTILENEGLYEGEGYLVPREGDGFVAQFHFLRYEPEGAPPFIVLTFQNLSHLKKLEKSLREAKHLAFLGRMLSDISHHVRNPISVIGGLARRLKESPEKVSSYSSALIYQCERLEELLSSLERFVLLRKPCFKPAEGKEIIEILKEKFEIELSGENPELVLNTKGFNSFVFYTDPELLIEALSEIIKNALESHRLLSHAEPVSFSAKVCENQVVFEVKDNGPGISLDVLPYIFNPFFTTKSGHFGMGLTYATRIMEELGGEIEVLNLSNPTVFRVFIPLDRRRPERRYLLFKALDK